jgi:signal peptidase I
MGSLLVWTAVLVSSLLLPAWAVTYAARRAGSLRGRFSIGLLAVLVLGVVNLILIALGSLLRPDGATRDLLFSLGLIALNVLAAFLVLKRAFDLPARRAFVPFAALLLVNLVLATAVYGAVPPHLCQAYTSPSISMAPTVEKGDRFSVNKQVTPRRWDVVVYRNERDGVLYCKRVAGLPGERIRFEDGSLLVHAERVAAPPVLEGRLRMTLPGVPGRMNRYEEGEDV